MSEWAWVRLEDGREVYRKVEKPSPNRRSDFACPMVLSDQCEVKSMVDGKVYTSKSALRQSYRANGYIEVGNEQQKIPEKPKPDRKAIKESVGKALSRVGLPT